VLNSYKKAGFNTKKQEMILTFEGIGGKKLLPALSQARERARQAVCMNNLKQVELAMSMYLQDYDEWFPVCYNPDYGYSNTYWQQRLLTYANNKPNVFVCSKYLTYVKPVPSGSNNYYSWFSPGLVPAYGYNHRVLGCAGKAPGWGCNPNKVKTRFSEIKNRNIIMILDNCSTFANSPSCFSDNAWYRGVYYYPQYRHLNGVNILFVDGHVEWANVDSSSYFAYTPHPNPYWELPNKY
jgi:prepilin-type processing-associated H-X9-DG protein